MATSVSSSPLNVVAESLVRSKIEEIGLKYTPVEKFISNNKKIKVRIDKNGKRGECITREKLTTPSMNISEDELQLHLKIFDIDEYEVEALRDVHCNRDALKELGRRLRTSVI